MMTRIPHLPQSPVNLLCLLAMLFVAVQGRAATGQTDPWREDTIVHQLVAEHATVTRGSTVGLLWNLKLDPHWHIYWQNPGDSGLPPLLRAEMDGIDIAPLTYPVPKRIDIDPITNYGYEDEVTLHTTLTLPANLEAGPLSLPVRLEYLYCKDICLPGTLTLQLPLMVGDTAIPNPSYTALEEARQATLPQPWPPEAPLSLAAGADGRLALTFSHPNHPAPKSAAFIPQKEGLINDNATQTLQGTTLTILPDTQTLAPPPFSGLLVIDGTGYQLPELTPATSATSDPAPQGGAAAPAFFLVLLGAFLAGLILNLMPCVLPVLALKVLGLVRHATTRQRHRYALGYTTGILGTFGLFALGIILLQQGGAQLGWGFHLQNPWFVALLAALMVLLTLNFWGVTPLGNSLTHLAEKPGKEPATFRGAIATGSLAVIVATPCTVPFMGGAMAYAFTQTWPVTLLVFATLGLGLAAPFLLLAFVPAAARLLPKPGRWMSTFKALLGWPMLATALWLSYVFLGQTGPMALFVLLAALLVFAAMLWWYGLGATRLRGLLVLLSLALGGYALAPWVNPQPAPETWHPWSKQAELAARENGPVFVDFTADWCITCKVVEATVLNTDEVQATFARHNTTLFVADWTRQDDAITAELAAHGRRGVPLYLLYLPGAAAPLVLPQIPTAGLIKKALEEGAL